MYFFNSFAFKLLISPSHTLTHRHTHIRYSTAHTANECSECVYIRFVWFAISLRKNWKLLKASNVYLITPRMQAAPSICNTNRKRIRIDGLSQFSEIGSDSGFALHRNVLKIRRMEWKWCSLARRGDMNDCSIFAFDRPIPFNFPSHQWSALNRIIIILFGCCRR